MRIYDTFLFDGEFDLLEHRLRETYDLVDWFVIVEAAQTFRGEAKPLHLRDNRTRFAWADEKLRVISLSRLGDLGVSPWAREALQREAIMLGLRDAEPGNIVLLLDADEIASRALLERLRAQGLDRPRRISMTRHYEYADQLAPASACCQNRHTLFPFQNSRLRPWSWDRLDRIWYCRSGVAVRFADLAGDERTMLPPRSAYDMRRLMLDAPSLDSGGRHLMFVDPSSRPGAKLGRVSHEELADVRALDVAQLRRARDHAIHHHGWWYAETPSGPLPGDLARLVERCPSVQRSRPPSGPLTRRLMRTWSWLRYWPRLGDKVVARVDRLPDWAMISLLAIPLLAADGVRAVAARGGWRLAGAWFNASSDHGCH
jgi:beta-1,4-mannosyl-glycoprotein beta-1,4-N-acetylglucosaminyltransferase